MRNIGTILLSIAIICILANFGFADDYYVDAVKGLDTNSGLYVNDAWKTITGAILKVTALPGSPAVIHVAAGTYNMAIGETFPITMKSNVQLIGESRDTTIIDAAGSGTSVILSNGEEDDLIENILIDGFTITGGEGTPDKAGKIGGGIAIHSTIITINDCSIIHNKAELGGGIWFTKSTLSLTNSQIKENITEGDEDIIAGGGIYGYSASGKIENCIISHNTSPTGGGIMCFYKFPLINKCQITDNIATRSDGQGEGGGIAFGHSSPTITNSTISNNKSNSGGGFEIQYSNPVIKNCHFENNIVEGYETICYAGAVAIHYSSPVMENCEIIGNQAKATKEIESFGGGFFFNGSSPSVINCKIENNTAARGGGLAIGGGSSGSITSCKIANNTAYTYGGGIIFQTAADTRIINCLINDNTGTYGGGVASGSASPKIINSTLFGNSATTGDAFYSQGTSGKPTITSSIVWNNDSNPIDGTVTVKYSDIQYGYVGDGNISDDPKFTTGHWGNYYLSQKQAGQDVNSPCINAGSTVPIMGFTPMDYITRTDGVVDAGTVDMGYHYQPHVHFGLVADLATNGGSTKENTVNEGGSRTAPTGDVLTLSFDVTTAPVVTNANLYLIMVNPDGNYYSAMAWDKGLQPLVQNLAVPKDLDIESAVIASFGLPSTKPPINKVGTYTFYLAALQPGTVDFISNIASASFSVQ